MPTITRSLRGACAAIVLLLAVPAWGQRVQFPTMLVQDSGVYGGGGAAPSVSTVPPVGTLSTPQPLTPGFNAAPISPGVQTVPPGFDPYSAPVAQPYSPYAPSPFAPAPGSTSAPLGDSFTIPSMPDNWFESATAPMKLVQNVGIKTAWLAPMGGNNKLGVTETNLAATLAIPVLYEQAPLLITPGFSFDFFQGPVSMPPVNADLPPTTYSAYVDVAWRPRILPSVTPWLTADLGVRTGIYTDFHAVNDHSIRVLGRGLALATVTEQVQLVMGVVYLDRVLVKILPAGGVIWTPNPDARYEIFFPSPKLSRRWTTVRTTDMWWFVAGEYGGGSWTVRRANGSDDQVDYNDIRVSIGLESFAHSGLHGIFDIGYVFDRALVYRSGDPSRFYPSDTIMLRAGLYY